MPEDEVQLEQVRPCPPGASPYTIRSGETLFALAQRFGTTVAAIVAANPGINPNILQIGQVICIPGLPGPGPACPGGTIYVIQSGDTLSALAIRFGISLQAILAANPGIDPNRLAVGQRICIPGAIAPIQRVTTPCCATLTAPATAPSQATGENPAGSILVRQIAMSTRSLTFSAVGLPDPGVLGDFDSYQGSLAATGDTAGETTLRTAVLGDIARAAGQPVTWAGSVVLPELPAVNDVAEIRPFNSATGVRGPVVLRGTLAACRR